MLSLTERAKILFHAIFGAYRPRYAARPLFEPFEPRILMAADLVWTGKGDPTNFFDRANWEGGNSVPDLNHTAVFNATGVYAGAIKIATLALPIAGIKVQGVDVTLDYQSAVPISDVTGNGQPISVSGTAATPGSLTIENTSAKVDSLRNWGEEL